MCDATVEIDRLSRSGRSAIEEETSSETHLQLKLDGEEWLEEKKEKLNIQRHGKSS